MDAPPTRLLVADEAIEQEEQVKSREEMMEILEAFDLTGSFRDAGELAGCSHHTVAAYVAKRDEGRLPGEGPERRERIIDPWLAKIEEWVERSQAMRRDVILPKVRPGDVLAFGLVGAYCLVRGTTFNGRPLPAEVSVAADGSTDVVRARQTVGELVDALMPPTT